MLALVLVMACQGTNKGGPMTVATFNAGLAVGFVAGAEDRAQKVADAVAALDADVVCLEEVWLPEDVAAVQAAAAGSFPSQVFEPPDPGGDTTGAPACAKGDLENLLSCLADSCGDVCQDELVQCVLDHCAGQFLQLPKPCQGCTMANVGGTPEAISSTCETTSTSYAYGGSYGTGVLAKQDFVGDPEFDQLESTTNRRGIHHVVVDAPLGNVDVYCTHLTSVFDTIPYPHETGSWAEEQAAQIAALRDWIDEKSPTGTVILAGDFNTGPALPGIDPEVPDDYTALSAGYTNPYVKGDPECTFCDDNPLVTDPGSVLIDHVLLRDFDGDASGQRIFTDTIPVETCGKTIDGALSDHYGLELTLQP